MIEIPGDNRADVEAANQAQNLLPAITVRFDPEGLGVSVEYDPRHFPHWGAVAMVLEAAKDLATFNQHLVLSMQAQQRMAEQAVHARELAHKLRKPR